MKSSGRARISEAVAQMPAVNHHEHAWRSFSIDQPWEYDLPLFLCQGYLSGDLSAAGFHQKPDMFDYLDDLRDSGGVERVWSELRPYLDHVRSTSYFRYLLRTLSDLFHITEEEIFADRWRLASDRVREYSRQHRGRGAELCTRLGVSATVLDTNVGAAALPPIDTGGHRVLHVARLDMFIHEKRGLANALAEVPARDFDEWLAIFDDTFHRSLDAGAVGLKMGLAYNRRIEFSEPSKGSAARVFEADLLAATPAEKTVYQDFMANRLCRLCVEADVPLQIHSGIQAGTGFTLEDTKPTLLTSLFQRHGDLRVDLFHGGYPWCVQAGLMAKYFPNVYVDGCWLSHISPSVYRTALTSWIETVPMNKILAWGGDHTILEHSYGSLAEAKDLITDVLAGMVDRGYMGTELAVAVARRVLHDNGVEFWRLGGMEGVNG